MSFNFIQVRDICSKVCSGGTPSTRIPEFYENGVIPWVKTKEVNNCNIYDAETFITQEALAKSSAKLIPENSVIIAMYGNGDTAGRVAINKIPLATNQACCNLIIDQNKADYRFVYYYFRTQYKKLVDLKNGGAQQNLNAGLIKDYPFPDVAISFQKKIADRIESFDLKVESNTSCSSILEQIAQAIFKSWFVDFEPTKAKIAAREALLAESPAATPEQIATVEQQAAIQAIAGAGDFIPTEQLQTIADLFPNQLVESDLGEIPEGWTLSDLNSICVLNSKSWTKKSCPPRINYVDLANTKSGVIEETTSFEWNEAPSRARRILSNGDTIVGTVRPGNRSYAYIAADHHLTGSTGFAVLTPQNVVWSEFLYIAATCDSNIERLAQLADGGAYPAVKPAVVTEFQLALPPLILVSNFHEIINPMFGKRALSFTENASLKMLRDNLLPKLLAGEMSYSDA